jgi:hypothetical protein
MKKDAPLSKKAKAEMFAVLVNKFLGHPINREDLLSDPKKIEQYWILLKENLWQVIDEPYWKGTTRSFNTEEKVDTILHYQRLVKFACVDVERYSKLRGVDYEKIKMIIDLETFRDWDDLWENLQEEDALMKLIWDLRKCKDELCGKWFVRRPNKMFCCHNCAARYLKRMKGKGDLQRSYRTRRPNKKKRGKL